MKPAEKHIHKILVVTLSNLGDVVLTLPVFQSLVHAFPKAKLDAVVGPGAKEVFEGDERIRKVILYNKKMSWTEKYRFLQSIRRERYDLIVDLRCSLIGFLGGARLRNRYLVFSTSKKHRAGKHLSALKGIVDVGPDFMSAQNSWLEGSIQNGRGQTPSLPIDLMEGQRLVVAAVGSKSDIKKWPPENYAKLLDKLIINDGCRVVMVGDKNDAADAAKVKNLVTSNVGARGPATEAPGGSRVPLLDFSGQTNFRQLAAIIQKASLVITNDSAPLHIADALKVTTLAIFGPTDSHKYGPRLSSSQVARRQLFCSPCEKAQCRYHHECMQELRPDELYAQAVKILDGRLRPKDVKILMIRLDRIGDMVLSLPAVAAVRDRFPNAHIAMMVRPSNQMLVEGNPLIDEVIPYFYEKKGRHSSVTGNFRFIHEIIQRKFDVVFILNPSLRSYLVPFCAGIPNRIGFKTWPFLLTHAAEDRRHEGQKHESEYTMDVVRAFGIETAGDKKNIVPVTEDLSQRISRLLERFSCGEHEKIIAIHPGASCISKKWPKQRFEELGKKIQEVLPYRLAIVGGKEEVELGEYLASKWEGNAIDLTGKLDLKELTAFLKRCDLLISNDSGPVHVASAAGTRTISIFGRNRAGLSPVRWRPMGEGHAIIQKDVGCVVCLADRCSIDFECLRAIEAEEVFETAQQILLHRATGPAAAALRL